VHNSAINEINDDQKIIERYQENTFEILQKLKEISFLLPESDTDPSFVNLRSFVIGYIEKSEEKIANLSESIKQQGFKLAELGYVDLGNWEIVPGSNVPQRKETSVLPAGCPKCGNPEAILGCTKCGWVKAFQDGVNSDKALHEWMNRPEQKVGLPSRLLPNHHDGFPIGYDNAVNQANPIPRRNGIGDQSSIPRSPAEPPGARMMALGGIKLDMPRKTATEILNEDIKKMLPGKPFVKKAKVKENNDK